MRARFASVRTSLRPSRRHRPAVHWRGAGSKCLQQLGRGCGARLHIVLTNVSFTFSFLDKPRSHPVLVRSETRAEAARSCHGHQACLAEVESEYLTPAGRTASCPSCARHHLSLGASGTQKGWHQQLWAYTKNHGITRGEFYGVSNLKAIFKVAYTRPKHRRLGYKEVQPHGAQLLEGIQLFNSLVPFRSPC